MEGLAGRDFIDRPSIIVYEMKTIKCPECGSKRYGKSSGFSYHCKNKNCGRYWSRHYRGKVKSSVSDYRCPSCHTFTMVKCGGGRIKCKVCFKSFYLYDISNPKQLVNMGRQA